MKVPASARDLTDLREAESYYDDRYATGYMETWPREKIDRVRTVVRALELPSSGVALDYGCGTGVFTEMLAQVLPGWQIVGSELSTSALQAAARRAPACTFVDARAIADMQGRFDLIFSHHVLEHVSNLEETADDLVRLLRPGGTMLHIMPCGNAGSLERRLCEIQAGGIDASRGNRFFFEDEGHLRRLTSAEFEDLWHRRGCVTAARWFANQFAGAFSYYTGSSADRAGQIAKPAKARGSAARFTLTAARLALMATWAARRPVAAVREKRRRGVRNVRDAAVMGVCLLAWPISAVVDASVRALADREWRERQRDPRGTEMYIALTRPSVAVRG